MKKFEIYDYFSLVIGHAYDKKMEFKKLINSNDLSLDQTICVGDTIGEVEAGKSSKISTISLSW